MRIYVAALSAAGIAALAAGVGQTQTKPSIEGVWKRTSLVVTGANPSTAPQQPGVYIYTAKHYAHVFETQPRKPLAAPKDANKLTDAEKLARYEAWAPFTSSGGTYEIKGTTITHRPVVSKAPAPATGYADGPIFMNVKIEANRIVRTATSADGKSFTTATYTRVE